MPLRRAKAIIETAQYLFEKEDIHTSYAQVLQFFNVLPHSSTFSEAEFSTELQNQRLKLEAMGNELIGNIYYINACKKLFHMKNAKTPNDMKNMAKGTICLNKFKISSWSQTLTVCEKFPLDPELQKMRLTVIPQYLLLCQELKILTDKETLEKIDMLVQLSKVIYDESSVERCQCVEDIIDLLKQYPIANSKTRFVHLSTEILYHSSKNKCKLQLSCDADKKTETLDVVLKLINHAQTRLLQQWEKENWPGTVTCAHVQIHKMK
ncbi:hypothetical protein RFI_02858 [Reticulomyxa filosa]|uniref:Uncharacterized protein n=1 Tax=Reticulomyxa filosa TaxID=46433 RepID=X6P7S0_RETFI|nr:hypothetical protein RFI_02858 [Reticulomyxa filosa]|eukprot:ETO34236.1 hypothetical protein RFI_02858 [Reticulomyxa filosa]